MNLVILGDYDILQAEGLSPELRRSGDRSSLSNWLVEFVFEIAPRSVLSSPTLVEGEGVN